MIYLNMFSKIQWTSIEYPNPWKLGFGLTFSDLKGLKLVRSKQSKRRGELGCIKTKVVVISPNFNYSKIA